MHHTPQRLADSLGSDGPWLFLSPHLDDAILSCGALMAAQAGRRRLTVATMCTEAGPPPHTRSARAFMRMADAADAADLFAERRREDLAALRGLGIGAVHLGATDAIYRRRTPRPLGRLAGRLLPELVHLYPTYRFHMVAGRVARGDRDLAERVRSRVSELLAHTGADLLFCPLAVGRHADHVLARSIGEAFQDRVVYYSDFPYNQASEPDASFIRSHRLESWRWDVGLDTKERAIRSYKTQADALFPQGTIPRVPEMYFAAP